jgi:serine/threonine protein kinase
MQQKQAVVIGIDEYSVMQPLRHAVHDATEVAAVLGMPEYGFEVSQLLDGEATLRELEERLESLLNAAASVKLFYFSGHGCANDAGVYLATADDALAQPGLSLDRVRRRVLAAEGSVILIFDCCHSGAAAIREQTEYKCMSEGDIDRSLGTLAEGKILIAACGVDEAAYESDSVGHGVFTFHLLEGLMGAAANLQGVVTPMGLYEYVVQRVTEDGRQTPVWKGEQAGRIILGAGFPAPHPLTADQTGVQPALLAAIEQEAKTHLDRYLQQVAVPYEEWKMEGFLKASQLLEPLLRWFDRHIREYPELVSRKEFREAHSEAEVRLAQLGALSEGIRTDEGEIVGRLGAGAFGTVWKVERPGRTPLAYKVYHSNELQIKEKVARFERGYRAMNQLDHPHIVKVHKFTNSPLGFYMDFIDGPNLRQFAGTLTEPCDIIAVLLKAAETLQHAHGRNVLHRDVKPENIVLAFDVESQTWTPYLTDFDLAWFSTATQVTKDAFGAIFYAAPEQLAKPSSRAAHSPTTDIYSFGQLSFFTVAGSDPIPFGSADNRYGLAEMIGNWGVVEAANAFLDLYEQCTRHQPGERPQTFRAVSDRLYQVYRLLRHVDQDERIDAGRFMRELLFAVAGLSEQRRIGPQSFRSLSGRTTITVVAIDEISGRLNATIAFSQDYLTLTGVTHHRARQVLNTKLANALRGYDGVYHRPGTKGAYEVLLDIKHVTRSLRGVDWCRQIITRAIDAIESG